MSKPGKDIGVALDGTWQRRGFSSLDRIVAAIAVINGNVLDVEVMSRQCKSCLKNAPLKDSDPEQYEIWRAGHHLTSNLNFVGSAPNMECTGAVKIVERSLQNYSLRYLGHYQKHVGNRLRKRKERVKGLGGQVFFQISKFTLPYKMNEITQYNKYRPISFLSNISKLFERIMYNHLEERIMHYLVL